MNIFKYLLIFLIIFSLNVIKSAEPEEKKKQETFLDLKNDIKNAIDNNNLGELDKLLNQRTIKLIEQDKIQFKNSDTDESLDPLEYALRSNANLDIIKLFISKEAYYLYNLKDGIIYLSDVQNIETFNYLLSEIKKLNPIFKLKYELLLFAAIEKHNIWLINYILDNLSGKNIDIEFTLSTIKDEKFFNDVLRIIKSKGIEINLDKLLTESYQNENNYGKNYVLEKLKEKIKKTLIESGHFPKQSEIPTLIAEYVAEIK